MTGKERKISYVYSTLCRAYDDMGTIMRFFKLDPKDEDEDLIESRAAVIDAYLSVEKAESVLGQLIDKYTKWEEDEDGN